MQSYPPSSAPPPPPGYAGSPDYAAAQQQVRYGGFWVRVAARLLDGLIIGVPLGVVFGIIGAIAGASAASAQDSQQAGAAVSGLVVIIYALALLASIAYFVVMWTRGATLGMKLLNLRVVDAQTGQNITYGKAFLRYVGMIISALVCYLGFIWVAFDARKQGWHDKIAGTMVLHQQ